MNAFKYNANDAEKKLIPAGSYDAEVLSAETKTSKAGNEMLVLTYRIWANGGAYQLSDFVVPPNGIWKLKALMSAVGLGERFKKGEVDPQSLVGKMFKAGVKERPGDDKYQASNVVHKYGPMSDDKPSPSDSKDPADDLAF